MKLENFVNLLMNYSRKAEVVFKQDKTSSEIRAAADNPTLNLQKKVTIYVGTKKK